MVERLTCYVGTHDVGWLVTRAVKDIHVDELSSVLRLDINHNAMKELFNNLDRVMTGSAVDLEDKYRMMTESIRGKFTLPDGTHVFSVPLLSVGMNPLTNTCFSGTWYCMVTTLSDHIQKVFSATLKSDTPDHKARLSECVGYHRNQHKIKMQNLVYGRYGAY